MHLHVEHSVRVFRKVNSVLQAPPFPFNFLLNICLCLDNGNFFYIAVNLLTHSLTP